MAIQGFFTGDVKIRELNGVLRAVDGIVDVTPADTYVPYTGATGNVDLGYNTLSAGFLKIIGNSAGAAGHLGLRQDLSITYAGINYTSLTAEDKSYLAMYFAQTGSDYKLARFNVSGLANNTQRTYSFPDASGTLALASDIPIVTGYVPYTGATQNVDLGEYGISSGYFQADLTPSGALQVGRMQWNSADGTMDLRLMGNNVTLQIGQEQVARVVNGTGGNLLESNYQAVKIIGAQGQRLQVGLARADNDANSKDTLGLVTENINNNQEGFITVSGLVNKIDTTGSLQGETWSDGDTLYLSGTTAGAITNVKPTAPTHTVIVGFVVYAHANNGKIYVKVDNGYELEELHDVAPTPYVNKGVLYRDTATNLWKSATIGTLLGYTPANAATTLTINGTAYDISANRTWSVGTVTSIATTGPLTGGTITGSGTIGITQATTSTDGYLSSTDWNTFNNKQGALTLTTTGSSGAATLVGTTLNIPNYGSVIGNYVPYTGATSDVNLGVYTLSANSLNVIGVSGAAGYLGLKQSLSVLYGGGGYTSLTGEDKVYLSMYFSQDSLGTNYKLARFNASALTNNTQRTYSLPDASGTIALTSNLTGYLTAVTASSPLFSSGGTTPNITIQVANTSQNGYLSSTDWNTFNNKQAAGNYITALTGEATASGPGSASVTLSTSAVTGKLLSGLNLTGGGTIADTDSILQAFGKVQNQISGLAGGVTYQGTWNASTNTPTLTSSVGTKGYYYIVDVAGSTNLNGITDWKIGDWAIFNGTTWDKVDNTDAVSSVNGFTGAVSLTTSNIAEGTNLYYLDSRARLALSFTAGSGAYDNTTGVITIPTNTSQLTNGANFITLSSLSASSPLAYNNLSGDFSIQVANGSQNGYLSSTDWTTFNSKQAALSGSGFVKISGTTISYDNSTYLTTSAAASTYLPLVLSSTVYAVDINGQQFSIYGSAGGYTSGRIIVDPLFSAVGYQISGVFYGLKIDTSGNASFSNSGTTRFFNQVRFDSTLTNGTYTYTLPSATGTIALVGGSGVGTVTSIATTGPITGGTITSTGTIGITQSGAASDGYLSSTDWNTFNNKQSALTNPVTGTGTTNYLPKFTGTSTIGNSLINDDGTTIQATRTAGDLEFGLTAGNTTTAGNPSIALYSNTGAGNLVPYGTIKVSPDAAGNTRAAKMVFGVRQSGGSLLDALTINSSGNLGLGVTPSAWNTVQPVFQIGYTAFSAYQNTQAIYSSNGVYTSGWKYLSNTNATYYSQNEAGPGIHAWFNAPSGTAGNAISFTQAMTLFANGNLSLGSSVDSGFKTYIKGGSSGLLLSAGSTSSDNALFIQNAAETTTLLTIKGNGAATFSSSVTTGGNVSLEANEAYVNLFSTYSVGLNARARIRAVGAGGGSGYGGDFRVSTRATNNVWNDDAFVVDYLGRVGIGTTSPSYKLDVNGTGNFSTARANYFDIPSGTGFNAFQMGADTFSGGWYVYNSTTGSYNFKIANSGAATFSSSIAATSATFSDLVTTTSVFRITQASVARGGLYTYNQVVGSGTDYSVGLYSEAEAFIATGGTTTKRLVITSGGNVCINATSSSYNFYVNGTSQFGSINVGSLGTGTVYSNGGTLTNTNPSDRRLKTNIIPLTYGLADILKLNPVSYNWKDGSNGKQFGFIAQEVQEIMPDAVKDGEYLGLEKDAIYSALVNAIKEQQTQINELKSQLK